MLCAITGSRGYLGQRLVLAIKEHGWLVREVNRACDVSTSKARVCFQLGHTVDDNLLNGVDVLVHCAYDYSLVTWRDIYATNVEGTMLLLESAKRAEVKCIVFISSITAFKGCRSLYGKAKLKCESLVQEQNGIVIRPGLIFGEGGGTVLRSMESWVQKLPIVPFISSKSDLYLCHIDDLSSLIIEIIAKNKSGNRVITAVESTPYKFKDVIRILQKKHNRFRPLLPVPWQLPWLFIKVLNSLGIQTSLRSDGLIGFVYHNKNQNLSALASYQTIFRSFK
jgi:nucleoside-diphosphate-sugar epimerase|tara:strand:- start:1239 stop:2078 length:840 start_codon:yes stop_codon:yes gene_type:complete